MVLRSAISEGDPTPKPSLAPAIERDFEKVLVTRRLSYFFTRGTQVSPPKSIYASSITTTLSGLDLTIFSISSTERRIPVGALGFAMKMVLLIPI